MDDGLDLWLSYIRNAVNPSQRLAELSMHAVNLLDYGSEYIITCMQVIEEYVLLFPDFIAVCFRFFVG